MSSLEVVVEKQKGSLFGCILMVSGCCIGGGMLGLPVITALAGFIPTATLMIFCWALMLSTGLLVLEANLWFEGNVNFLTMSQATLGRIGRGICFGLCVFLLYSLLVAYNVGSGILIADFFSHLLSIHVPEWVGNVITFFLLALCLYLGSGTVDRANRLLMLGMVFAYLAILVTGLSNIRTNNMLNVFNTNKLLFTVPIMLTSFGYQNLVPSLTNYLGKDPKHSRIAIIVGCTIPLIIYIVWEYLILGLIPQQDGDLLNRAISSEEFITRLFNKVSPSLWASRWVNSFAFFAIATSILTTGLSCHDFLSDALPKKSRNITLFLVLIPPFFFSLLSPHLFLTALSFAGGIGAVTLFGMIPVLMVWRGRYRKKMNKDISPQLPGGKPVLVVIAAISVIVFSLEVYHHWVVLNM